MLRARILTGEYEPGGQLPSQAALSEEFGVARMTIQQALRILEDDGLVSSRQGSGMFARERTAKPVGLRPHIEQAFRFNARHGEILQALPRVEAAHRNRIGGYWIAGENPQAANYAISGRISRHSTDGLLLCTDGFCGSSNEGLPPVVRPTESECLRRRAIEKGDSSGTRWPRPKPHGDMTVVRTVPARSFLV